jgi:hypothetical protein
LAKKTEKGLTLLCSKLTKANGRATANMVQVHTRTIQTIQNIKDSMQTISLMERATLRNGTTNIRAVLIMDIETEKVIKLMTGTDSKEG